MNVDTAGLFGTVAEKDYLGLLDKGGPRCREVARLLSFDDRDVAQAAGVSPSSVRLATERIPIEVAERVSEWAQALNLVAHFFHGDGGKTALWFAIPNPLLGGVAPRDMIRLGRFRRLFQFIREALAENTAAPEAPGANA